MKEVDDLILKLREAKLPFVIVALTQDGSFNISTGGEFSTLATMFLCFQNHMMTLLAPFSKKVPTPGDH